MEYLCWIKKSPALCACSLSMYLAIMPLAAQNQVILLFDTTQCATCLIIIGTDGLLAPLVEKKVIPGNSTGRRPGDVTFHRWVEGKGLCVDVAVISSPSTANIRKEEPCEWYAATQKRKKYDESFVETNYIFSAMVFETLGAVNVEGEEVLQELFRFAAKQLGREFTSYCGRAWARISYNLQ